MTILIYTSDGDNLCTVVIIYTVSHLVYTNVSVIVVFNIAVLILISFLLQLL